MWDQEKLHLSVFDSILAENRIRPTALRPFWELAGFALGAGTALMGKEAAMACTEAVETVIGHHYNEYVLPSRSCLGLRDLGFVYTEALIDLRPKK